MTTPTAFTGTRTIADPAIGRAVAMDRPAPHLHEVLLRVVVSVATTLLVPSALLWTMVRLFNFPTAVIVALAWMIAAMVLRRASGKPVFADATVALVFLASWLRLDLRSPGSRPTSTLWMPRSRCAHGYGRCSAA